MHSDAEKKKKVYELSFKNTTHTANGAKTLPSHTSTSTVQETSRIKPSDDFVNKERSTRKEPKQAQTQTVIPKQIVRDVNPEVKDLEEDLDALLGLSDSKDDSSIEHKVVDSVIVPAESNNQNNAAESPRSNILSHSSAIKGKVIIFKHLKWSQ